MNLALAEMRRSKLRFGLLSAAVALLVFLVLLLTTLSSALVGSLTGAIAGLDADGVVYADSARDNLQASRLDPAIVGEVAAVSGVAAAAPVSVLTTSAPLADGTDDLQLFGMTPGAPGQPRSLDSGALPASAAEIAMDGGGYAIGDIVELPAVETAFTVVGLLRGAQFNASPTGYITQEAFDRVVLTGNPNVPFVPANAIAFQVAPGADPVAVAVAIEESLPGVIGYSLAEAVDLIPGVGSIAQTFGILVGLTFIIGIVVIGFFFLILTVQKLRSFTLLRALGASKAALSAAVATQIALVVLVASAIAVVLTYGAVQGLNTGIPVALSPSLVATTVAGVLAFSLVAGLLSIRRITTLDPATATGAR